MNWELIRIWIDVISVGMFILMGFLLWFAYKGMKKVKEFNPMNMVAGMMNPVQDEDVPKEEDKVYIKHEQQTT